MQFDQQNSVALPDLREVNYLMVSSENVIGRQGDCLDLGVLSIASHLVQCCSAQQLLDGAGPMGMEARLLLA